MNYFFGLVFIVAGIVLHKVLNLHLPGGLLLNLGETSAMIGFLLIMFPVIKTYYTEPLGEAIQTRNSELEGAFSEVESLRSEMKALKADYETRLVATEAEAREKINSQIKEAQALRQSLMAEAASRSEDLVRRAQEEIAGEKAKVLTELRTHVTDLALAAATKVVHENMNTDLNRKIVDDFIANIEVAK